jgi:LPS O-antigen subunit length determinant protein (WzzB/FepE family)
MININEIEKQVQESIKQKIENELQNHDIFEIISQHLNQTIQEKVNVTVTALLNRLINENTVANQISGLSAVQIQEKLDLAVRSRVASTVSQTDLGSEISLRIEKFVQDRILQAALPENFIPADTINWDNFVLSADKIGTGTIENFTSTGIQDRAESTNLTVLDGQVIVEKVLVANDLKIVNIAEFRDASVNGRLTVNGTLIINDSNFNESLCSLMIP